MGCSEAFVNALLDAMAEDAPTEDYDVSDTGGYVAFTTHNTTAYVWVGNLGKPQYVYIDNAVAQEGVNWTYNASGKYVKVYVPSSYVVLKWPTSTSSGGGGGGVVAPQTTNTPPPNNIVNNLPPQPQQLSSQAKAGLALIIAVVGVGAGYSELRRRRRIPALFSRRYKHKTKVRWHKTRHWWE